MQFETALKTKISPLPPNVGILTVLFLLILHLSLCSPCIGSLVLASNCGSLVFADARV